MKFEWNELKKAAKHGIAFEDAALVFTDPDRLEYYDVSHSMG